MRKDVNYLCHDSVEEWYNSKYMFLFILKIVPRKVLK